MLEKARRDLVDRLSTYRGDDTRFTPERMRVTMRQIELVMGQVGTELQGLGEDRIRDAAERGMQDSVRYMKDLEKRFRGITVPLALERAALFDNEVEGVQSTLLRQFPTSVRRYGAESISKFEDELQQGVIQQRQMDDVIEGLVERDSFFEGRRYWAERIVRTETLSSYGRAAQRGIVVTQREDWPDLRKVLVGFFDDRTGPDTKFMDGQVRKPDEPFIWRGPYHRNRPPFQSTPKRPNCRCITVAWRPGWPKPPTREPLWGDVPRRRSAA
jgi:hypothetical protein